MITMDGKAILVVGGALLCWRPSRCLLSQVENARSAGDGSGLDAAGTDADLPATPKTATPSCTGVDAASRRPRCKTGMTAVERWETRVCEHENGRVKSVRSFARPRQYTPVAACPTLPSASAFAHELERLWGCVPTPGW